MKKVIRNQCSVISRRNAVRSIFYPLLAILSAAAVAQEKPTNSPVQLPPLVITATRLPEETIALEKVPANVTVITREAIAQSPAFTLPELLRQQVGFTSLDTVGFAGQQSQFSLRGFGDKSGTLILVDGVRANDAGGGFFLWNSVPLAAIERVEIIRGGASTIYGEGAAAGVINIITKEAANKPLSGSVGASGGNLGFYQGNFALTGRTNALSYVVTGSRNEWAGWRDGANYRGWNILAKPSVETPAGRFTFGYQFHDDYSENADVLTPAQFAANPRQRGATQFTFEQELHRGWVDYHKTFEEAWTVNAKAFATKDNGFGTGFAKVTTVQPSHGGTLQVDWKTEPWQRANTLTFGGEVVRQEFAQTIEGFGTTTTVLDSTTLSFFAQDTLQLLPKLSLAAGVRFDHRSSSLDIPNLFPPPPPFTGTKQNNVWSPKVSLSYEFAEKSSAWASLSQAYRLPSANDIVSGDPRFASNASLVPVNARTVEFGMRSQRHALLGGSVAYYHSWVDDDIFSDPATFGNNNANAIRQGVELALNSRPAEWMDLDFSATWSDAHFTSGAYAGQQQVLVPDWQLNGGVNFRPAAGWTWRVETVYVTGQRHFNDLPNTVSQNTYTVVNTKLSYQWKNLTTYASVNNLLDRLYEQFPTYNAFVTALRHNPAPGINFQLGVTVTF
ncbi:MAG: TonB-dependent receptor [Limisphaerales bacterium]